MVERDVAKIAAGEGTPHGLAEVAVHASLAPVIARRHGDHLAVARVTVELDGFVPVPGGEENHAALSTTTIRDGIVDGVARAGPKLGGLGV